MHNICFVFTNFNNSDFTELLLDSLIKSDAEDSPVIVVDNASETSDINNLKRLEQRFFNLKVIYNNTNVGYFNGLNIGLKYCKKIYRDSKYIVIGNNDLLFSPYFAQSILESSDDFLKYPVVSPNITMLDGVPQNPHVISKISKIREFIYNLYHLNYYLAGLIVSIAKLTHRISDRNDEQQHDIAQEIYQGYGACYILGPKFFEHFDELWAPTFLMYEEFFLAKQLEEKGFKIYYEPLIKVKHHCHTSTGQLPSKKRWEFSKAAHQEYRKYLKNIHVKIAGD